MVKWQRLLDHGDEKLRELVEQDILHAARRVLGDYRNKLLLSLPPETKAHGAFELGRIVYEADKWPFGLRASELLQNLAIFGRSGAGKTNVVFALVQQLARRNVPF